MKFSIAKALAAWPGINLKAIAEYWNKPVREYRDKRPRYVVAANMNFAPFLAEVNKLCDDGYEPVGGMVKCPQGIEWQQAMYLRVTKSWVDTGPR